MSKHNSLIVKYNILYLVMLIVVCVIIGKIIYFQFFYDEELVASCMRDVRRDMAVTSLRGNIYSTDGKLLATSLTHYIPGIDPSVIADDRFDNEIDSLCLCLSQVFKSKSKATFKRDIIAKKNQGRAYYGFSTKEAGGIDYFQLQKLKTFPLLRERSSVGGFTYTTMLKRTHPFGRLAYRTIGDVKQDTGKYGLENYYDDILRGGTAHVRQQQISGGAWVAVDEVDYPQPKDIVSTIDTYLQDIAETSLVESMRKHEAKMGTVIVMEVRTGRIRAIANLCADTLGRFYESRNLAVAMAVDPGSTFKLASLLVALEDGVVDLNDTVDTGNGKMEIGHKEYVDTHIGGYGRISLKRAFEVSSNIGIARVIYDNYRSMPQDFVDGIYRLGLNQPLNVSIKGETRPEIRDTHSDLWSGLSLTQMAVGYEIRITPLQMLTLYNAVANNGCMLRPQFVESVLYHGQVIEEMKPVVINPHICSAATIAKARQLLEGVVEEGTGKVVRSENYTAAGKTGTAQMNYRKGTKVTDYHASFIGYFPADTPDYSIAVSVYQPRKNGYYGGQVAAPVFKAIADKIYSNDPKYYRDTIDVLAPAPLAKKGDKVEIESVYDYLNIPYTSKNTDNASRIETRKNAAGTAVVFRAVNFRDIDKIPDVRGMGLKDAVAILEERGLVVNISGRGRVTHTEPPTGSNFSIGDKINLILEL